MRVLYALMMVLALAGCTSVRYVAVDRVKHDSIYITKAVRDSTYEKDSVSVKESGDTIWETKYKYIYRKIAVHDTTYVERTDTVAVPYPVEAKLTRWQQIKINIGGYIMAFGCLLILIVFIRFVIAIKKHKLIIHKTKK